jgi:hypothetical protein
MVDGARINRVQDNAFQPDTLFEFEKLFTGLDYRGGADDGWRPLLHEQYASSLRLRVL